MNNRACPICNSLSSSLIQQINLLTPDDFILPTQYDIRSCDRCGFVFNDTVHSEQYETYYKNYKCITKFTIPLSQDQSPSALKMKERHALTARFLHENAQLPFDADILDIGCSYGGTLLVLKELGYVNLMGIDVDAECIAYVQKNGIKARTGNIFSDVSLDPKDKFDVIILGHIIEHLHEPRAAIESIIPLLKPSGKILIECPDLSQYPETGSFPGFFAEWEHINHFSIGSLTNLMCDFSLIAYKKSTIYALIENFPCQYALFKHASIKKEIVYYPDDKNDIWQSLQWGGLNTATVKKNLDSIALQSIALWGAGQYSYRLLSHTQLKSYSIAKIVDKDPHKHGVNYFGIPIQGPEELKDFNGTIVICSTTALDSILKNIKELGLTNKVIIPFISLEKQ